MFTTIELFHFHPNIKETIQIRTTKENMRISWRCDHIYHKI